MEDKRTFVPREVARFDSAKMEKVGLFQSHSILVGLNCFEPGQKHAMHTHAGSDKVYVVSEGTARFTLGPNSVELTAGDVAIAPAGEPHALENVGRTRLVVVVFMAPPPHGT
ncbi:MAG: cupin domain-containing protein [Planctomycetes bacterium]|nr:cupin domain-containing protein [Planctomycetota bacterium]MBI3845352.1 cupin domain-containing protein [Planctomycetota bacterium]